VLGKISSDVMLVVDKFLVAGGSSGQQKIRGEAVLGFRVRSARRRGLSSRLRFASRNIRVGDAV
jgi:hypothetical protein